VEHQLLLLALLPLPGEDKKGPGHMPRAAKLPYRRLVARWWRPAAVLRRQWLGMPALTEAEPALCSADGQQGKRQ
jgi:hypothetical protein